MQNYFRSSNGFLLVTESHTEHLLPCCSPQRGSVPLSAQKVKYSSPSTAPRKHTCCPQGTHFAQPQGADSSVIRRVRLDLMAVSFCNFIRFLSTTSFRFLLIYLTSLYIFKTKTGIENIATCDFPATQPTTVSEKTQTSNQLFNNLFHPELQNSPCPKLQTPSLP